tara:strand:+ start:1683 stop:2543 length:861 start_codon:yes stop_codon:yes gene_type:complete
MNNIPTQNFIQTIFENKGLNYENDINRPEGTINQAMSKVGINFSPGESSMKSADTNMEVGGKSATVEVKSHGSAFGQSKYTRDKGVYKVGNPEFGNALAHYLGGESSNENVLADPTKRMAHGNKVLNGHLNDHYHNETHGNIDSDHKNDVGAHWDKVHKADGEMHLDLHPDRNEAERLLQHSFHQADKVHIDGHGTYALNAKASQDHGVPHILDHIDQNELSSGNVLSVRHRVKTHKTLRDKEGNARLDDSGTPMRDRNLYLQLNMNKKHLKPSTHDMTTGKGYIK